MSREKGPQLTNGQPGSRRFGPAGRALALYILLTPLLTYPLCLRLATAVPSDIGDPLLNTWILAWVSHALLADPLNLFNANIFYPLPQTLAYSEHLFSTALLALPLQLLTGEPVVAYNLSLLASFPLAAFGMYLLARRWTGRAGPAFVAGLIFAFSPYRFAAIAHLQLLTFQWLPLAALSLELLLSAASSRKRRAAASPLEGNAPPAQTGQKGPAFSARAWLNRRALALLVFLLLQLLASWYLAVYSLFCLGVLGLAWLVSRRPGRPALVRLGLVGLLAGLLVWPLARPYLGLADELAAARPVSLALSLAARPADYLAAAPFNRLFGPLTAPFRARPAFTEENTLFLGLVAPLLALAALASRQPGRATLIALLVILILSAGLTFPAPYAALARFFPAAMLARAPARWIIPALFALAGLATVGLAWLSDRLARKGFRPAGTGLALVCAGLLLVESLSAPLPLADVSSRANLNPAYHWLAARPGPLALVELPLHSAPAPEYPEVKRLYASTLGWWGLVNGYSGYTPPRQPELAQALAGFPDSRAIAALQALAGPRPLYLLVHPGEAPLDRTTWENDSRWAAERNPALAPLGSFEGDYLYRVSPPEPGRLAGPALATFGQGRLRLLAAEVEPGAAPLPPALRLYWQAAEPASAAYTVFVHLAAPDGFVVQQADGPPVSGRYPTPAWPPGEVVQDVRALPILAGIDHLAIGLYDPSTGERLPAFGPDGERLGEDAVRVEIRE